MATKYHNLSEYDSEALPSVEDLKNKRFAIVVADWNSNVTYSLCNGAHEAFLSNGVEESSIDIYHVPGTFELTYAAARLINMQQYSAIVVIGCVIQGDTPHFDFVCQGVTQGITMLNSKGQIPVVFSVLTTLNLQQALDRAGGKLGNKGIEGAVTALKMINNFPAELSVNHK